MQLKESGEMYLETIYVLSKKSNYIRSIDVCEEMGYSKPSVSRAVGLLKEGGYLSKLFVMLGVNPETAAADACKMEHIISDETFAALKNHLENHMQ